VQDRLELAAVEPTEQLVGRDDPGIAPVLRMVKVNGPPASGTSLTSVVPPSIMLTKLRWISITGGGPRRASSAPESAATPCGRMSPSMSIAVVEPTAKFTAGEVTCKCRSGVAAMLMNNGSAFTLLASRPVPCQAAHVGVAACMTAVPPRKTTFLSAVVGGAPVPVV
jgi:hypothetical protein